MSDNINNVPEQNDTELTSTTNQETPPEENIPKETVNTTDAEESNVPKVEESNVSEAETESEPEAMPDGEYVPVDEKNNTYAFEWNYTTLAPAPKQKKRRSGLVFGLIMTGAFVIALIALIVTIIFGIISGTFNLGGPSVDFDTTISTPDNGPTIEDPQDASTASLEAFKNATVVVLCDNSTGTGIILGENGMIVTNYHVIEDATTINVYLYDGRSFPATVIGGDSYNDIAVIKINATGLIPAAFADSDDVYTGERVYAVGTPAGPDFAWSVSAGIVSHPNRELKFYTDEGLIERSLYLIQTDALVNPGNSGGPLINKRCEVIGIVTMRLTDEYVGMGFAIPTNTALPIIEEIIEGYRETPSIPSSAPQLGITGIVVEKGEKFQMNEFGYKELVTDDYYKRHPERCTYASHTGIYVLGINEGFDAHGKLSNGDIIIGADKSVTATMDSLKKVIIGKRVGDTISLTIIRDGSQMKIDVVLGKAAQ